MKKILLCGDSYYDIDSNYPGLHWMDRLPNHEVITIARGGASNFSIWHQIQQVEVFKPDLVLISFTSARRVECIKTPNTSINLMLSDTYDDETNKWIYRDTLREFVTYAGAGFNKPLYLNWMPYYIPEFEIMKNAIFIRDSLNFLENNNIKYKFTLGGFTDNIQLGEQHEKHNILPNGWLHSEKLLKPIFHIKDETWHIDHAKLVEDIIKNI